jgi:hypothetical protein
MVVPMWARRPLDPAVASRGACESVPGDGCCCNAGGGMGAMGKECLHRTRPHDVPECLGMHRLPSKRKIPLATGLQCVLVHSRTDLQTWDRNVPVPPPRDRHAQSSPAFLKLPASCTSPRRWHLLCRAASRPWRR